MNEAIDEALTGTKSKQVIIISHGYLFTNKLVVILGYLLLLLGLIALFQSLLTAFVLLFLGGLFGLSTCGIILDKEDRAFKEYTSYFFVKAGKWQSLDEFPDAAILNLRYSQQANLGYFHSTNVKLETQTELVLLTSNHRKRVLVKTFKKREKSAEFSKKLCSEMGINLTTYSPQVSARTAARRRR